MKTLVFDKGEWKKLKSVCEKGYPKEVCGLLLGESQNPHGIEKKPGEKISRIEVLENILNGKHSKRVEELLKRGTISIDSERALKGGYFEFYIDPQEHYQKLSRALARGLDQIGVFHSHPDHPAIPSTTDASQPFLAGWSNLIVAVRKGKFKEARSWFRATENSSFQEQKILLE